MNSSFYESTSRELYDIERICYGCTADLNEPGMICPHCGWDNSIRSDNYGHLPATTIGNGRFFVGRALGSGGFGVTYIGRDLGAGAFEDTRRAIKEYFPVGMAIRSTDGISVLPASSNYAGTLKNQMKRARREGDAIRRASDQSLNVVKAYDCLEANGTTYIVMEYIDGDTLTSIVKKNGPFGWKKAFEIFSPVLDALERMHSLSIYHMDISPDNIMLRKSADGYGEPVILDFGASVNHRSDAMTQSRSSVAVRDGYTPPEQYNIDKTSQIDSNEIALMDEYAVSATLYYVITGQVPASAIARSAAGKKLVPLSSFDKTVPEYFDNALQKGMSLIVSDRYVSVEALKRALEAPRVPVKIWKIGVGAAILCIAGAAVFLLTRPSVRTETIQPDGSYTWNPADTSISGELIGTVADTEVRYTLQSGESINLSDLKAFSWSLEETGTDGKVKKTDLVYPGN